MLEKLYEDLEEHVGKALLDHYRGKYELMVHTNTVSIRLKGSMHQHMVYDISTQQSEVQNIRYFKTVLERALISTGGTPTETDIVPYAISILEDKAKVAETNSGISLHTKVEPKGTGNVELNIAYSKHNKVLNWVGHDISKGTKEKIAEDIDRVCNKDHQQKVTNLLDHINSLERVLSYYALSVDYVINLTIGGNKDITREGVIVPLGGMDMMIVPPNLYVKKTGLSENIYMEEMGCRLVVENDGGEDYKIGITGNRLGKIKGYLLPTDTDAELHEKMYTAVKEEKQHYVKLREGIQELHNKLNA